MLNFHYIHDSVGHILCECYECFIATFTLALIRKQQFIFVYLCIHLI